MITCEEVFLLSNCGSYVFGKSLANRNPKVFFKNCKHHNIRKTKVFPGGNICRSAQKFLRVLLDTQKSSADGGCRMLSMHIPESKARLRIQVCMDEGRAFRLFPSLAIQNVSGYGECPGKAETVRTFSDEAIAEGNTFVSIN